MDKSVECVSALIGEMGRGGMSSFLENQVLYSFYEVNEKQFKQQQLNQALKVGDTSWRNVVSTGMKEKKLKR